MNPEAVRSILKDNNIPFEEKPIQHGLQFRFKDGAILSAFETGTTSWQGKASKTKARVSALIEPQAGTVEAAAPSAPVREHPYSNRVFIVYGHDTQAREQLELLLRRLKLEPLVLQNVPSAGQTIIEKLETCSNVTFACVLLTPDDEGHIAGQPDKKRPRARQNVVLELGMFLAKLGRKRVAILHKGDVELPSDINGLLYIPFKERVDEIKERVAAELQEAGFQINIKDLLS
jgi:predicted nucleotide-binding protein